MARNSTAAATLFWGTGLIVANDAFATDLNAGYVLNQMNADQRIGYISGVVEGLAYARFLKDHPSEEGMTCIYDWYDDGGTEQWSMIQTWFERHSDKPAGVLLYVLIKQECGE